MNQAGSHLEPGLLRCCRAIRAEARPIFCQENPFKLTVYNCRVGKNLGHWVWNGGPGPVILPCENLMTIHEGTPSWSALKTWVKAWRSGRVKGVGDDSPEDHVFSRVCCQAFELADTVQHARWDDVDAALEVFRKTVETCSTMKIFDDRGGREIERPAQSRKKPWTGTRTGRRKPCRLKNLEMRQPLPYPFFHTSSNLV